MRSLLDLVYFLQEYIPVDKNRCYNEDEIREVVACMKLFEYLGGGFIKNGSDIYIHPFILLEMYKEGLIEINFIERHFQKCIVHSYPLLGPSEFSFEDEIYIRGKDITKFDLNLFSENNKKSIFYSNPYSFKNKFPNQKHKGANYGCYNNYRR